MSYLSLDPEAIRQLHFFSHLPDALTARLLENAEHLSIEPGQVLMAEGSQPDCFYVVLDGDFEILKWSGGQDVSVSVTGTGEILGEMSLIENVARTFTVRAIRRSEVIKIDMNLFNDLLAGSPEMALALLRTVMNRLRKAEGMLRQQEKLASLGTLAAGLAHELNNPAAAAQRSASQLQFTLDAWLQARRRLDQLGIGQAGMDLALDRLRQDTGHDRHTAPLDDPLAISDREADVQSWLEERGMDDAWEVAPLLVGFGWDISSLETWSAAVEPAQATALLHWLAIGYNLHNLTDQISEGARRISEIVGAVKSYTYLDQAPHKEIDVHEGLENTLVILHHKLKKGVTVRRQYDTSLPRIQAYPGELNQVWTNLIDNAIDAMQGQGELRLRTYRERDCAVVEVADNGPGIPPEIVPRLFEPFFTTKAPGSGTGLGLHVSYGIVQKHRGQIEVRSQPGDTCFKVSLPLSPES